MNPEDDLEIDLPQLPQGEEIESLEKRPFGNVKRKGSRFTVGTIENDPLGKKLNGM